MCSLFISASYLQFSFTLIFHLLLLHICAISPLVSLSLQGLLPSLLSFLPWFLQRTAVVCAWVRVLPVRMECCEWPLLADWRELKMIQRNWAPDDATPSTRGRAVLLGRWNLRRHLQNANSHFVSGRTPPAEEYTNYTFAWDRSVKYARAWNCVCVCVWQRGYEWRLQCKEQQQAIDLLLSVE